MIVVILLQAVMAVIPGGKAGAVRPHISLPISGAFIVAVLTD
jgi:hypothetical protein